MTAADFSNLHLQYKAEQGKGEVPAVIDGTKVSVRGSDSGWM